MLTGAALFSQYSDQSSSERSTASLGKTVPPPVVTVKSVEGCHAIGSKPLSWLMWMFQLLAMRGGGACADQFQTIPKDGEGDEGCTFKAGTLLYVKTKFVQHTGVLSGDLLSNKKRVIFPSNIPSILSICLATDASGRLFRTHNSSFLVQACFVEEEMPNTQRCS